MREAQGRGRLLTAFCGAVIAAILICWPATAMAATVHVDGSGAGGPGCGATVDPCKTVQQGVNAAAAGDTVAVAPGTYQEQVDIPKALTIDGSGIGQTTILSPPEAQLQDKFDFGTLVTDHRPVVYAHGVAAPGGVDISDLTVDADAQGGAACSFDIYAIAYFNAGGEVAGVEAKHITNDPFTGCTKGQGIVNYNVDGQPRAWAVTDSVVSDFQKSAIQARQSGLTSRISGNEVIGHGPQTDLAQNGIVVTRSAAEIAGNEIRDLQCNQASCGPNLATQAFSSPIFIGTGAGPIDVHGNLVENSDLGISDGAAGGVRTFRGNTLRGNRWAGVWTDNGSTRLTGNVIRGSNAGIYVVSYEAGATDFVPHLEATGNQIVANDFGVDVHEYAAGADDLSVALHANRMVSNANGAIRNNTPIGLSAQSNWYGCNAGPGQPGCDTVEGAADIDPWLVLRLGATPDTVDAGGGEADVRADVSRDSTGDPTGVEFPDGEPVAFGADLGSVTPTATTFDGVAAARYASPASPGDATVSATLDNQTVTTPIAVREPTVPAEPVADPAHPPRVETLDPAAIRKHGAVIRGGVHPSGLETSYHFEWGLSEAYKHRTAAHDVASPRAEGVNVEATLTGLDPGTVYHYRVVAKNADGVAYGDDQVFETAAPGHCGVVLKARPGGSTVIGSTPSEHIEGSSGHDRLYGRTGGDCMFARKAGDRVYGQRGSDTMIGGGTGKDRMSGGPGNDWIRVRGPYRDHVWCGSGRDVVIAGPNDRVDRRTCERIELPAVSP